MEKLKLKMSQQLRSFGLETFFRDIKASSCSEGDTQKKRQILGNFEQSEPLLLPDNGETMLNWITAEVIPSPLPVSIIECPEGEEV